MRDGCNESPRISLQREIAETRVKWSTAKMHTFELRSVENGFELRRGHLTGVKASSKARKWSRAASSPETRGGTLLRWRIDQRIGQ
jgi:hypothetical protein